MYAELIKFNETNKRMTGKDQSKILRFSTNTTSPAHETSKKYQATAKYDRKSLKKRLSLEEWMHYELRKLYNCKARVYFLICIFVVFS